MHKRSAEKRPNGRLVVGIVGTVSAGKTTLARELARQLGGVGYVAEIVPEFAREYKQR